MSRIERCPKCGATTPVVQGNVCGGCMPQANTIPSEELPTEADCPDCDGAGWGVDTDTRCCGGSEYECGGRGCTGPEPEQVQVQCERCCGTGKVAMEATRPTTPEQPSDALRTALEPFVRDFRLAGVPSTIPDKARYGEIDCDFSKLTVGDFRRAEFAMQASIGEGS